MMGVKGIEMFCYALKLLVNKTMLGKIAVGMQCVILCNIVSL